jgi:hypothetical protein
MKQESGDIPIACRLSDAELRKHEATSGQCCKHLISSRQYILSRSDLQKWKYNGKFDFG